MEKPAQFRVEINTPVDEPLAHATVCPEDQVQRICPEVGDLNNLSHSAGYETSQSGTGLQILEQGQGLSPLHRAEFYSYVRFLSRECLKRSRLA